MENKQALYDARPMMLEQKAFNYLTMQAGRELFIQSRPLEVINNIATIYVQGVLSKRPGMFDSLLGFTSYERISGLLKQALDDSSVSAILLDIDSPGGEVAGLFDLCDEIFAARDKKPVWAIANEEAFSAAYAIGSSAEKLYVSRTGGVGSIGVIASHIDQSSFDEKQGIKITTIFAGKHKNDLNPHKPLSSIAEEILQTEINRIYDMFTNLVVRNRQIASDVVKGTEAGLFFGPDGIRIGLADGVMTRGQVLELIFKQKSKGKVMTKLNLESSDVEDKSIEKIICEAENKARESYRAEILELAKACKVANMPDMLSGFIERSVSVHVAKDELMQALVSKNSTREISSNVDVLSLVDKPNPVIAAAKARAYNFNQMGE